MPKNNLFTYRKLAVGVFLLILTSVGTISLAYMKQKRTEETAMLPTGNWTLSSGLFTTGEPSDMPVVVLSVTTDGAKGLTTNKAQLQNNGAKMVEAVKFRWKLYKTDDPDKNLLTGETPLIGVALQPREKRTVEYPIVSFAKIHKPLLQYGTLAGDYRVEITVGEVHFEDGSVWLFDEESASRSPSTISILNASNQGNECCSKERCFWQGGLNPPRYGCVTTIALTYCSPAFNQCTEGRCPSTWRLCGPREP